MRLMLDFQAGNQEAFRRLVQHTQAKVYAVIYRLIPDHAQVEDLVQEVFLRVFRTAGRYQPMAKFSTWLYRIAANVALNALRARRRVKLSSLELADRDDESSWRRDVHDTRSAAPVSRLDAEELRARILAAIAQLPENQRIAITLNRFEHMSYQQIAAVLDCSTMAVKSLLSRARCNLRESLLRYLGGDFAKKPANPPGPP